MENRSEEDHKLSQGTYGPEKRQEGLGKPDKRRSRSRNRRRTS